MSKEAQPRTQRLAAGPAVFPMSGWRCIAVRDLRQAGGRCDACGRGRLRYVHVLAHDSWPAHAHCGCVCAGHLEGDPARARERERRLRIFEQRRTDIGAGKGWRSGGAGRQTLGGGGWHAVVFPVIGGWDAVLRHRRFDYDWRPHTPFVSQDQARLAIAEELLQAEATRAFERRPFRQGRLFG